jgi:hypothetical protein
MPSNLSRPFIKYKHPAFRSSRLINFPTGKADLQLDHKIWLQQLARDIGN